MTLQVDAMLAEARAATGLADFGEPLFIDGLQRLAASINGEAGLADFGLEAQRRRIVGLLCNRLRHEKALKQHPQILEVPITAPLVIVGLPRTGSTMTHRLLAADPAHTAMLWWEGRYPAMLPGEQRGRPEERRALGEAEVAAVLAASPEALDIHPWAHDDADEEILLLEHCFLSTTPEAFMHVPSYSAWVEAQDHSSAYADLKRFLQALTWQNPGREKKRWVLKSPHHLGFVDKLLAVFADARVIHTHRHPLETVPSFCSMCANLAAPLTHTANHAAIGAHWAGKLSRALAHCMAVSDAQAARFLHLQFADMVADPIAQMQRLYAFAGEPFGDRAQAAMRAYREDDAHRPGSHRYALEDYGLDAPTILRLFAPYIERYGLQI